MKCLKRHKMSEMTYSKAGVNIEKEELAIKGLAKWLEKSFVFRKGKVGEVADGIGNFANAVDLGDFFLVMTTDGVGSKVLVAQELGIYDKVGIDLVAMLVNDLICLGAEPIAMVDYLAVKEINPEIIKEIAKGIYWGAKEAEVAVIGGETATLPEIISGIDRKGFDLAGAAIGTVKKDKIVTGREIKVGDVVLGLKSSGIHSNGLTLARKVLPKDMWVELITPTKIYVKEVLSCLENFKVHGLVNITGGGFRNLERVSEFGFLLDNLPVPPPIFQKIKELGNVSEKEMNKTFNMGVGFCVIVDEKEADSILKSNSEMMKIGRIVEEEGVRIVRGTEEIKLA